MSRLTSKHALGLCWGVLLSLLWAEASLAASALRRGEQAPQDAGPPLAERIEMEKSGRDLFLRDWSKKSANGDGLGPMYNDVSCVACHQQGAIGGGGGTEKNVRLLHLVGTNGVPLRVANPSDSLQKKRRELHPDFQGATSVVLHRHAVGPGKRDLGNPQWVSDPGYQRWLVRRLPAAMVDPSSHFPFARSGMPFLFSSRFNPLDPMPGTFRSAGTSLRITERNTTSLFGAGLIDSIPDAAIVEVAERQKKLHAPLITGRVPQDGSGAIGRFGWRGQIASLQDFVMTACAVEVGLTVPGHQQAQRVNLSSQEATPVRAKPIDDPFEGSSGATLDLDQNQCDALTAYVASLPAPKNARAGTLNLAKSAQRGEVLFERIGCATCHVRDVGPAMGLFSDLLLHDMGPGLSDPLPAVPELNEQTTLSSGGGYFGPSLSIELVKNVTTNIHQEWRTPPLWGVASSSPYLHDGRAMTLEQAIQWHGGEGQRAAEAFRALKPNERQDLLQFLDSLTAPTENEGMLIRRGLGANGVGFF